MSCPDYHSCQTYSKQFSYLNLLKNGSLSDFIIYEVSLFVEELDGASCLNQMTTTYSLDVFTFAAQKQAAEWPRSKGLSLDTLRIVQDDTMLSAS